MMLPYGAAVLLLGGSGAYYYPYFWRYVRVFATRKQLSRHKMLALTYDDGPSETLTPKLLRILRLYDAHATFFLLGCNAKKYPAIADQIHEEGHEIGCHSGEHLNAWKVTPSRAIADIDEGYETLSRWVSSHGLFRPPYGKITLPTWYALKKRGANISWWTVDSRDTKIPRPSPHSIVDEVARTGGGIVLMHDLGASQEREEFVCRTSVLLLEMARKSGLHVVRLRDLVTR